VTGNKIAARVTAVPAACLALLVSIPVALPQDTNKASAKAAKPRTAERTPGPSLGSMADNLRKRAEQLVTLAAEDSLVVPPPSLQVVAGPDLSPLLSGRALQSSRSTVPDSSLPVVTTPITEELNAALLSAANAYGTLATALDEYEIFLRSHGQDPSAAAQRLQYARKIRQPTNEHEALLSGAVRSARAALESLQVIQTSAWLDGAAAATTNEAHRDQLKRAAASFERYLQLRSELRDRDHGISDALDALQDGLTRVYSELAPTRVAEVRRTPRRLPPTPRGGPGAELVKRYSEIGAKLKALERAGAQDPQIEALRRELAARRKELAGLERSVDTRIAEVDPEYHRLLTERRSADKTGRYDSSRSRTEREIAERRRAHLKGAELADLNKAILAKRQQVQEAERAISQKLAEDPEYRALRQERDSLMKQYRELLKQQKSRWERRKSSRAGTLTPPFPFREVIS